jgi:hypothetical protein
MAMQVNKRRRTQAGLTSDIRETWLLTNYARRKPAAVPNKTESIADPSSIGHVTKPQSARKAAAGSI